MRLIARLTAVLAFTALFLLVGCGRGPSYGGRPVGHPIYGRPGSLGAEAALPLAAHQILVSRVDRNDATLDGPRPLGIDPVVRIPLARNLYHIYLVPGDTFPWSIQQVNVKVGDTEFLGLTTWPVSWHKRDRTAYFFKVADCGCVPSGGRYFHGVCGNQKVVFEIKYWNPNTRELGPTELVPDKQEFYLTGG